MAMNTDAEAAILLLTDAIQQLLTSEAYPRRVSCALDSIDAARASLTREWE